MRNPTRMYHPDLDVTKVVELETAQTFQASGWQILDDDAPAEPPHKPRAKAPAEAPIAVSDDDNPQE